MLFLLIFYVRKIHDPIITVEAIQIIHPKITIKHLIWLQEYTFFIVYVDDMF